MRIETHVVSRDDTVYEAFPALGLTASGKLICVYLQCTRHTDRSYTRIVYRTSIDRGRSWSAAVSLTEGTAGLDYFYDCPSIARLRDGRMIIAVNRIPRNSEDTRSGSFHESVTELYDGGLEGDGWNGPHPTPVRGIVPDTLIELDSGRWLLSAHRKSRDHGYLEQMLWYSDDKGSTWSEPVTLASVEGLHLCEVSILPLSDGTLVAFMRENTGEGWDGYKSISRDNGETWEGPYRMPIPGCHRPVARRLAGGGIMLTYRFYQGGPVGYGSTQNFFAARMSEEAAKETERRKMWIRILPLDYDRSPLADNGYSGWVQLEDGEIYAVQYIADDAPLCQIRGYSFREDVFILPQAALDGANTEEEAQHAHANQG